MTNIEWSLWANEQAFVSSYVIWLGSALAVAGGYPRWYIGLIGIFIGLCVLFLEYPRGKRERGSTIQRKFQHYVAVVVVRLGIVSRNYYSRFVLYMIMSVPCFFILPTILGGASLIFASFLYFLAAYKGEHWAPEEVHTVTDPKMNEPTYPPPRLTPPDPHSNTNTPTTAVYVNQVYP